MCQLPVLALTRLIGCTPKFLIVERAPTARRAARGDISDTMERGQFRKREIRLTFECRGRCNVMSMRPSDFECRGLPVISVLKRPRERSTD
jgi:hypothetical protein